MILVITGESPTEAAGGQMIPAMNGLQCSSGYSDQQPSSALIVMVKVKVGAVQTSGTATPLHSGPTPGCREGTHSGLPTFA